MKWPDQKDFLNKKSSFFIKISLKKVLIYFIQLIRKFLTRFKIIKWFPFASKLEGHREETYSCVMSVGLQLGSAGGKR